MAVLNINPAELGYAERYGRLISCALRVPGLTVEAFLAHGRGTERFLWQTQDRIFAGVGIVAELTAWGVDRFQRIQQQTTLLFQDWIGEGDSFASPRLFGGFSFQHDFVPDNTWSIYAPAIFILPHYQFAQQQDRDPWLILNVTIAPDEDPELVRSALREALDAQVRVLRDTPPTGTNWTPPTPVQVNYPMPFTAWEAAIQRATDTIKLGQLEKVVLARAFEIRFSERVNVENALCFLSDRYANCYRFLFEPRPYHAFYGATPERLIRVEGKQITTMGLAGSIRRGKHPQEDQALADAIWNDPKERLEHDIVVKTLREKLTPLTCRLDVPETPQILRLSNIQHLYTPISGELCEPLGVLSLLERLHPTPALGGKPRETALQFILDVEPVPRGWYAAPVGWIAPNMDGEFGVAIRSAVSEERRVWLYAGAGIVGSSLPQREWDETTLKFRPMLEALGLTDLKGLT